MIRSCASRKSVVENPVAGSLNTTSVAGPFGGVEIGDGGEGEGEGAEGDGADGEIVETAREQPQPTIP